MQIFTVGSTALRLGVRRERRDSRERRNGQVLAEFLGEISTAVCVCVFSSINERGRLRSVLAAYDSPKRVTPKRQQQLKEGERLVALAS